MKWNKKERKETQSQEQVQKVLFSFFHSEKIYETYSSENTIPIIYNLYISA